MKVVVVVVVGDNYFYPGGCRVVYFYHHLTVTNTQHLTLTARQLDDKIVIFCKKSHLKDTQEAAQIKDFNCGESIENH